MRKASTRQSVADRRRQRGRDTPAGRARQKRGAVVVPLEVDEEVLALMHRLDLLRPADATNRRVVANSLGKLLRLGLAALRREIDSH